MCSIQNHQKHYFNNDNYFHWLHRHHNYHDKYFGTNSNQRNYLKTGDKLSFVLYYLILVLLFGSVQCK